MYDVPVPAYAVGLEAHVSQRVTYSTERPLGRKSRMLDRVGRGGWWRLSGSRGSPGCSNPLFIKNKSIRERGG